MKSLALNASGAPVDALSLDSALPTLLSHAPRECEVYADLYGNIFLRTGQDSAQAPVMIGFSDEHCATALACLKAGAQGRPLELVYMAKPCSRTGELPGLDGLPIRQAPTPHAFIALSLHPPVSQHWYSRWYQLHCHVSHSADVHAMALSHNAIVLAFHSIQRIQAVAQKISGQDTLQLSVSRLHTLPGAEQQVRVNFCARHADEEVLEAFAARLARCLPSDNGVELLSLDALAAPSPHFDLALQRLCQHLATRHYPLSLASFNDAAYLARQSPSALITLGSEPTRNSQALLAWSASLID